MSRQITPERVNVKIQGDVSGQIAIGNNILQIGEIHGGIVNIIAPEKKPVFAKRTKPVHLRPRDLPGFIDREQEQITAVGALAVSESVSVFGEGGIGKTALLRRLAYQSPGDSFPDGIVYLSARGYALDDLRQYIFEAFHESDSRAKPTEAELRRLLQELKALILLDDLVLNYSDAAELVNSAPQCSFIFASTERCLWGEGYCIELGGLSLEDSVTLFEHELRRPLDGKERTAAQNFCRAVGGHPLYILQGAALALHEHPFTGITDESEETFVKNTLAKLTRPQRQVISLLTAAGNAPMPTHHLIKMIPEPKVEDAIRELLDLKLIQAHSPAYNLTGTFALTVERTMDISDWEERLRTYFIGWIKQNPPLPDVTDALNVLLNLLEKSNRDHRWDDVIAIGRGIEKALILGKRWSAWMRVLEMILKAAEAIGNRAAQGWALHQLGTRELCINNLDPARQFLTQALKIREALNDKAGAAVTRHNLNLIVVPPAPPRETPRSGPKPGSKGGASPVLKTFLVLVAISVTVFIAIRIIPDLFPPGPVEPAQPIPAATTKAKPAAPSTKAPTRTPTKTITPSPTLPPCRAGIWYCEDFDDGKAQFWELESGWSIQNDVLNGKGHRFAILTDHEWSDYRVNYHLNIISGTIHLNYRLSSGSNGFYRYFIGVDENGVSLSRQNNDRFTPLDYQSFYIQRNSWHAVEIYGWGGHLRIYMDDEMVIEYVDENYISSGTIAFETLDNSSAQIDNIEVTGAGDEPPVYVQPVAPPEYVPPAENPPSGPVSIITPNPLPVTCTSTYMTWEEFTDRPGMDYWSGTHTGGIDSVAITASKCQQMCLQDSACKAFTYDTYINQCWLKNGQPNPVEKYQDISGIKVCQ